MHDEMNAAGTDSRSDNKPLVELLQYINPEVHERARQAIQAHESELLGYNKVDPYKTVMCQTWLETAACGFGANCKFAHGPSELRYTRPSIRNNKKYKTRLCEKYTVKGICPYGSRCLFIHPDPAPPHHQMQVNGTSSASHPMVKDNVGFSMHPQYVSLPFQTSLPMGCSLLSNAAITYTPISPMMFVDQMENLHLHNHHRQPSRQQNQARHNLLPAVQLELRMERREERKQQIHHLLEKQQYQSSTSGLHMFATASNATTATTSTVTIKEPQDSEDTEEDNGHETVATSLVNVLDLSDVQL